MEPFAERQISVLQTFADQAVIAIENARLFEEVQARTRELQESLEYQTATSEVLQRYQSLAGEIRPCSKHRPTAPRLCQADFAYVFHSRDDDLYHRGLQ